MFGGQVIEVRRRSAGCRIGNGFPIARPAPHTGGAAMSTAENQTLVHRFFAEVGNGRGLAVADELFAADHAYHDPFILTGPGLEGMKQVITPYHAAFSDASGPSRRRSPPAIRW